MTRRDTDALYQGCDLALVACSAMKGPVDDAHGDMIEYEPGDLYTGQLYRLSRAWAERQARTWAILSARWGLLTPYEGMGQACMRICSYDFPMSRNRDDGGWRLDWWQSVVLCGLLQPTTWADETDDGRFVRRHAPPRIGAGSRVVALCGRDYLAPIERELRDAGVILLDPLRGLGIGARKKVLRESLEGLRIRESQLTLWPMAA